MIFNNPGLHIYTDNTNAGQKVKIWCHINCPYTIFCFPFLIGSVLIFEHHILHEGSELLAGEKYTIRSDVMFEPPAGK